MKSFRFGTFALTALIFLSGCAGLSRVEKEKFGLVKTVQVTVPAEYDQATCLDTFDEDYVSDFKFFEHDINDEHYRNVTDKLYAGEKFLVEIYEVKSKVTSEECLAFLASQRAKLVGAQGLSVFYEATRGDYPFSELTLSFDKEKNLWKDKDGNYNIPALMDDTPKPYFFNATFTSQFSKGTYILCFRKQ